MSTQNKAFTDHEKKLLASLVNQHIDIIESKRNCGTVLERKNKCWLEIVNTFNCNARTSCHTVMQLKSLWRNLKSRSKQRMNNNKSQSTGNAISRRVIGMLMPDGGLYNPYDCDAIPQVGKS